MEPMPAERPLSHVGRSVMSDQDFCKWVSTATPGDTITYYSGFLSVDTCIETSLLSKLDCTRLGSLAVAARRAFDAGLVHLVQKRIRQNAFIYLAIARPVPFARRIAPNRPLVREGAV